MGSGARGAAWIVGVGLAVSGTGEGHAQMAAGPDSAARAAVARIDEGRQVRLQMRPDARLLAGRIVSRDASSLLLADGDTAVIAYGDLERVWVRGHHAGRGALIGGALGLAAGAAFGYMIGEAFCYEGPGCTPEAMLYFGGIGGAGGAAVGALIGLLVPDWKSRFP